MSPRLKKITLPRGNIQRVNVTPHHLIDTGGEMAKPTMPKAIVKPPMRDEFASLKAAASVVQRIRISAQRELGLARRMRADAQRYQKETEMKARSEAQRLILKTRLSTQREIEELIRQASEEIQKVLADMRVIRITAQEELAVQTQRKFSDAAKLNSMSYDIRKKYKEPEVKKRKKVAAK